MFIFLGGPPGPSNTRDDKGKGDGSIKSSCWTQAFFFAVGGPQEPNHGSGLKYPTLGPR